MGIALHMQMSTRRRRQWTLGVLLVSLLLQVVLLTCLCPLSTVKLQTAAVFDVLWLARMAWAEKRGRGGVGWIFYLALMATSPVWIGLLWESLLPALGLR